MMSNPEYTQNCRRDKPIQFDTAEQPRYYAV
jgi:hypothetical protein